MKSNSWTLFDKVVIVARKEFRRNFNTNQITESEIAQGYVVPYGNEKIMESAMRWGTQSLIQGGESKEYPPTVYEFDNKGFKLELLDSADDSSQGGKLSFWNCLVRKDDHVFKIGISSDALLALLKQSEFSYGCCKNDLCFVRHSGGVAMMHDRMKEYQDAISYEERKKMSGKGKTKKWVVGRNYITATIDDTYLGEVYSWLTPILDSSAWWHSSLIGFKVNKQPEKLHMTSNTIDWATKLSDYKMFMRSPDLMERLPARSEGGKQLYIDMLPEEIDYIFSNEFETLLRNALERKRAHGSVGYIPKYRAALTCDPDTPFYLSEEIKYLLNELGLKLEYEE